MKPIKFTEPLFTFAEALASSGADNTWLRTFIARDKSGQLGTKHRNGRLFFSLNDIVAIAVLWGLNARLRIAPAAVWEIVGAMGRVIAESNDAVAEIVHVALDDDGRAFVWTTDTDGIPILWSGQSDDRMGAAHQASLKPHVVIPAIAILQPIAAATKLASEWPANDDR